MWAVEQRIEEINLQAADQAHRLLIEVIECGLPDADVLTAATFYRSERTRVDDAKLWRDKARPTDDVRVFDWALRREVVSQ